MLELSGGLRPWSGPCPVFMGLARTKGIAQIKMDQAYGGAEPRLTSGGEAGVDGVKFRTAVDLELTSGGKPQREGQMTFV